MKKKLLISSCLLGLPCRYDGKSKPLLKIRELEQKFTLCPVCPEVLGGLETPRIPCEIQEGKVIRKDGADCTISYINGAKMVLKKTKDEAIYIALLKEKSPSCGKNMIYDGTFSGTLISGKGVCAKMLEENGITVFSENELDDLIKNGSTK